MAKKQITFADKAKALKLKYTRAEWDPLERKDFLAEMEKLKNEQEEARAAQGIADHADSMDEQEQSGQPEEQENAMGGKLYPYGGYDNTDPSQVHPVDFSNLNANQFIQNKYTAPGTTNLVNASANNLNTLKDKYMLPTTSATPFAISAGASAIGDIASIINANKTMPRSVTLPRMSATKINLDPQRNALQRGYNTASNVMLRNSRDAGNPANAYANQIAGTSQLMDSFGNQMGQSYMNEANVNAQYQNNASQTNAEIGSREAITSAQLLQQRGQVQRQYINSLSQTIPMAMRDFNQQSNQTNTINMMGKDYGRYEKFNPNETWAQRWARLNNNSQGYVENRYGVKQNNG